MSVRLPPMKSSAHPTPALLEHLRTTAQALGRPPRTRDLASIARQQPGAPGPKVYYSRFGSFSHALERAGIRP